ncbi:MAG: hypothetical protein FJX80_17160 [Bacteroidetes bacterium]|nr:hypothetical protein [Bacteroidota bacterium]
MNCHYLRFPHHCRQEHPSPSSLSPLPASLSPLPASPSPLPASPSPLPASPSPLSRRLFLSHTPPRGTKYTLWNQTHLMLVSDTQTCYPTVQRVFLKPPAFFVYL